SLSLSLSISLSISLHNYHYQYQYHYHYHYFYSIILKALLIFDFYFQLIQSNIVRLFLMDIKSPRFGSEKFWPFSLDDKLTIICNQSINCYSKMANEANVIKAQIVDSLIIVRIFFLKKTLSH